MLVMLVSVNTAACGYFSAAPEASATEGGQTRMWTDSLSREVELPEKIEKIAVTGPMAQIVLYALAPEMLVGLSLSWSDDVKQYIPERYLELPVLGQLYGGKEEISLEELLAAAPDIVIDVGESKKSAAEDFDALTEQTGIPFVHIAMTTATAGEAFRKIGNLLGLEKRAEEYAVYCERVYDRACVIADNVGKGNFADFLYITGEKGLNVIARGSYHAEIIDFFTNNLAAVDEPSAKGTGNEVDMEQILNWNPDYIVFAPESIYDRVAGMPEWQGITAIKNGNYYEVPFGPYNWMGFPASIQRYLGMMWLPVVLYPEYVSYDLKTEVKEYYKMFYHCELSDEQYDSLTACSLRKAD